MAINPMGAAQNFYLGAGPAPAAPTAALQMPMAMAAIDPNAQRIIDACEDVWPSQHNACNFFVRDVANALGVTLNGTADQIADLIKGAGWTVLAGGPAARAVATQGKLVVAAMKAADFTPPRGEGHVAVVVAGPMNPAGWAPAGYWGSTDPVIAAKGGDGSPISQCWRVADRNGIVYASRDI